MEKKYFHLNNIKVLGIYRYNVQYTFLYNANIQNGPCVCVAFLCRLLGSGAEWQRASTLPACLICNQDFIELDGGWFLSGQTYFVPHTH